MANVDHVHAHVVESARERGEEGFGVRADVSRDHDLLWVAEKPRVGPRDFVEDVVRQVLAVDAADVISFEDSHFLFPFVRVVSYDKRMIRSFTSSFGSPISTFGAWARR